jgi:hypothetical protein
MACLGVFRLGGAVRHAYRARPEHAGPGPVFQAEDGAAREQVPVQRTLRAGPMNRPRRFLIRMGLFLVMVAALAAALGKSLATAFMGNPGVNGVILGILVAGIAYIFRQVLMLAPEIEWIEGFRQLQGGGEEPISGRRGEPRLLAPMARMLGARHRGHVSLSASSLQTLLDGIGSRLSETRETSRYLIGVLIFLGLLGTFYGLLETLRSVGGVISGMNIGGGDLARAFANLKAGLESPLAGMGTAFSASLFGLAGSLVLGFLDLQAGQAQNRFYNDLEEWLSSFTRLSGGSLGDAGEAPIPVYIQALLEQTADNLENLQRILSRGEEARISSNATLANLSDRLGILGEQMKAGQMLMLRLAENQLELKPVLARLGDIVEDASGHDDTLSNHLRNIEAYTARLIEDMAQGRAQSVQELRGEIRILARTIAALAEEGRR